MAFSPMACQIWMGSLEPYMTENFILNAFKQFGDNPTRVKIMRDKYSGKECGYCFVHFEHEETARMVLHKLNGKIIPNTNPAIKFRLNAAGGATSKQSEEEFSVFVGDLPPEVDDFILYKCMAARYRSLRQAKIVFDNEGKSKGFGFLRFASQSDQLACMKEMQGYTGLGGKMKVGTAKGFNTNNYWKKDFSSASSINTVVPQTYDYTQPVAYDSASWQQYAFQNSYVHQQQMMYSSAHTNTFEGNDDMALIEHKTTLNIDEMNQAVLSRDIDFWDSIESSKWSPVETLQAAA